MPLVLDFCSEYKLHPKVNNKLIGGSCGVTLVIAFGFLPQNFRRWQGPMHCILSFYEWRLSGGVTQGVVATLKPYLL